MDRRNLLVLVPALVAAVAGACSPGTGPDGGPTPSDGPIAQSPTGPEGSGTSTEPGTSGDPTGGTGTPPGGTDGPTEPGGTGTGTTTPTGEPGSATPSATIGPTPREIGHIDDAVGDTVAGAPAYADVRAVTVEDVGTNVRFLVDLGAQPPNTLAAGETVRMAVVITPDGGQGDYLLFVDGDATGYNAYRETPDGIASFQGRFRINEGRLLFETPWADVGAPTSGAFRAFIRWTSSPPQPQSTDNAPDQGSARFQL